MQGLWQSGFETGDGGAASTFYRPSTVFLRGKHPRFVAGLCGFAIVNDILVNYRKFARLTIQNFDKGLKSARESQNLSLQFCICVKFSNFTTYDRAIRVGAYKYRAFISYSHKDKAWANWLHKKLETYRFPRQLSIGPTDLPRNLKPIFRDREELSAGHDLAVKIESALRSSENLIVICSPDAAKSYWVNQEILFFKRNNRDAKIFSVIVDGEPFSEEKDKECFPPGLRFELTQNGDLSNNPAEPLAADFRDQGDGKRLGLLKLISGMVGLGVDDLVQRDLKRAKRRVMSVTVSASAILLAMGGLTIAAFEARDEAESRRTEAEGLIGFMLGDLKDRLEPVGRLDVLDGVAGETLGYFGTKADLSCSEQSLNAQATILATQIAFNTNDTDRFNRESETALELTSKLIRSCGEQEIYLFNHGQAAFWSGYNAYYNSDEAEAFSNFEKYAQISKKLKIEFPQELQYQYEYASSLTNLGAFYFSLKNDYEQAQHYFDLSINEYSTLLENPDVKESYRRDYADSLGWMAETMMTLNKFDRAEEYRLQEITLCKDIIAQSSSDSWDTLHVLSGSLRSLAEIYYRTHNFMDALKYAKQSESILVELNNHDSENAEWARNLAFARAILVALYKNENKSAEVKKYSDLLTITLSKIPNYKKYDSESFVAKRVNSIGGKL